MRNWIIEANQAENLSKQENPSRMRDFLVSIGSNRRLSAGMLFGGIQNPLEFLGGNASPSPRLWRGRGQFGSKSNLVSLLYQVRTYFQKTNDAPSLSACVVEAKLSKS